MMAINLARWCRSPVRKSVLQWAGVDLMYKLAAAASVLLLCATGFVAALVSTSIGKAIVDRYGAEAALFTDSFVAPRIQELAERSTLLENKKVELDGLFAPTVVGRPIHERQTGASVIREMTPPPSHVPFSLKASLYRFVREALDMGTGPHCVRAGCADDLLFVEVRHTGDTPLPRPCDDQQWVRTFQDRIESIGGELLIKARSNAVSYTAQFKIEELEVRLG